MPEPEFVLEPGRGLELEPWLESRAWADLRYMPEPGFESEPRFVFKLGPGLSSRLGIRV